MIRSKKELGQILLDNQDLFGTGLCSWINVIYYHRKLFTKKEAEYLLNLVTSKKPIFIPIINIIYNPDEKLYNNGFYWRLGYIEPRIKWIKKHLMK